MSTTTLFPQSRKLSSRSGVDSEWSRSLFDFLDRRPKSATYSMAFALTCVRTYELSEANIGSRPDLAAGFEAARELLHLLDDNINDRTSNYGSAAATTAPFNALDFARANDAYVKSFDELFLPVARYCRAMTATTRSEGEKDDDDDDDKYADAVRELHRVLNRTNEHAAATMMRIPANSRCSVSVERIDMSPLLTLSSQQRHQRGDQLRKVLNQRIAPSDYAYTYLEAYIAYAPMIHRYESLSASISRWNEQHLVAAGNDDERDAADDETIRCILLPTYGVWQGGTSQILWIVMHIMAALTVQRRNRFVHRALAILEHLSFYVWCADCSMHWRSSRGDDYFRHVSSLPTLNRFPIDIVLLRCHNIVNANSAMTSVASTSTTDRDGFASKWTLANLCMDYRDFAAIGLLKRGDRESSRAYRANLCRPMVRAIERIVAGSRGGSDDDGKDDSPDYLLSRALVDSGATTTSVAEGATANGRSERSLDPTATMQKILLGALRQQHGEELLRKLWHDVDPSITVPVCAMY